MYKKILVFLFLYLIKIFHVFGQRSYERYKGPLPSSEVIKESLTYGIPILLIGFFVIKALSKAKDSNTTTNFGCLGMLMVAGGILCLYPLLIWIETIVNVLLGIAILIFYISCSSSINL
jgi:hypothetical protein